MYSVTYLKIMMFGFFCFVFFWCLSKDYCLLNINVKLLWALDVRFQLNSTHLHTLILNQFIHCLSEMLMCLGNCIGTVYLTFPPNQIMHNKFVWVFEHFSTRTCVYHARLVVLLSIATIAC